MEIKPVFQHNEHGVFVSETIADESPLEPGVFLIPAGCVEIEPPPPVDGKLRVFGDGAWQYQDIPQLPVPPEPVLPAPGEAARGQRDTQLAIATLRIAPLQDAVDLGIATPAEQVALTPWKQYRVELNRIEQQPGFPDSIDWPVAP